MINTRDVLNVHQILIDNFGGVSGIRDASALDAAINRPFSTFDGVDLYSTPIDKASALIESIIINHPFVDGNKRTGYVLMRLMLLKYNQDIHASIDDKYSFVIRIATGNIRLEEIKKWLIEQSTANI